jgi:hypothetical protein
MLVCTLPLYPLAYTWLVLLPSSPEVVEWNRPDSLAARLEALM